MKNISEITKNLDFHAQGKSAPSFDKRDAEVINALFLQLQGIFPGFRQAWSTDALFESAKKEWAKAFVQAGINNTDKISIGIAKCRLMTTPWVPSIGQFIEMCKPEVSLLPPLYIGLPNARASEEVQRQEFLKMMKALK